MTPKKSFKKLKSKLYNIYNKKYGYYTNYLGENFFEELFNTFFNIYDFENGINSEISFMIYLKNQLNKRLTDIINAGNIDLEIELIDKYSNLLNYIILKMNIENKIINREDILITAIENYDGNKFFSLHIVEIVKNKTRTSSLKTSSIMSEEHISNFDSVIEKYLSNNKFLTFSELSYLDNLLNQFNIITKTSSDNLRKYIYLKCGYYKGFCFNDNVISNILSLSKKEVKKLHQESLILLKEIINNYIDLIISYDFNNINNKKKSSKYLKSKAQNKNFLDC